MTSPLPLPAQRNRLGRGLASLIGENVPMTGVNKPLPGHGEHRMVPVDRISPSPFNPRKSFPEAELEELAVSIREKGLVQPIVLRPIGVNGQHYEIVAGERRWRAAQRASQHLIPAIVRALSDQEALELAIIENVQRSDLNAIEEATGYRDLIERFGYKQEELGQIIGKSRSHLANTMRLLKLPEAVQNMVRNGELSAGHARALIGRDDVDVETIARDVIAKGMNVREVEALFSTKRNVEGNGGSGSPRPASMMTVKKDADTRAAERDMSDAIGLAVEINPGSGEAGEIIIRYRSLEQFEAVRRKLTA